MKWIANLFRFLLLPMSRARMIRRDDNGQVLILTGIMVLMAMMMTVTTINTGHLVYNRIRAQNAVDAAADTFAAFQSRGLNFAQHLNDVHYWANWIIFGLESANYGARILCPLAGFATFPFYNIGLVRLCCTGLRISGKALDEAQNKISVMILKAQGVINTAFPVLAGLSANSLAEANGADKVPEWLGEVGEQMAGLIGMDLSDLQGLLNGISNVADAYALPLKLGQLKDLNIEEFDPDPDYLPWDDLKIIEGLVIASDIACAMVVDVAMNDEPSHGFGWDDDTYYCGGPSYNTWIAGKKRRNIWPAMERLPWLNPTMGTADNQDMNVYTHQDGYPVFVKRGNVASGSDNFRNPAFFVVASSQVGGSPLMERSSHSNFEEFAHPELISVHLGEPGSDSFIKKVFIWH